jgi:hypothetical protein
MDVGPLEVASGPGTSPRGTSPHTRVSFSHAAVSAGFGVRIEPGRFMIRPGPPKNTLCPPAEFT